MKRLANLGEVIRDARVGAKRSQRDLARAAGVTQAHIDRLEHNQLDPRYSTIRRVLKELGYELVAIPTAAAPMVRDLLHAGEEAPLIDFPDDGEPE